MSKVIKVRCSTCEVEFDMVQSQYKYQTRAGRTSFYCSRSCTGNRPGNLERLKHLGDNYKFTSSSPRYTALKTEDDKLKSSMKDFIRRFRDRSKARFNKLGEVTVTVEHLVDVWKQQSGRCHFTGVDLTLPRDVEYSTVSPNYKASVDRISNDVGYINGNVRFVSHTVNNMRNVMTDKLVLEFFNLVQNKSC